MPGLTDPDNSMKKTRAAIFRGKADESGAGGTGDTKNRRWYWYSGVPEHLKPPVKHSQGLELRTINDRTGNVPHGYRMYITISACSLVHL